MTSVLEPLYITNVTVDSHWLVPDPDSVNHLESGPDNYHDVLRQFKVSVETDNIHCIHDLKCCSNASLSQLVKKVQQCTMIVCVDVHAEEVSW